jgi:hypothetical protein
MPKSSFAVPNAIIALIYLLYRCADAQNDMKVTDQTRKVGLVICRGTAVIVVCPLDGVEEIANPFLQQE